MGYINELKSMISELMQYDISVEELEDFLGHLKPESNLYYKLSDVHTMYAAFEEYLRGQYVTAERVLDVLADAAEESQLLKGAVFAFDGFTGFTPVQMKLLHRCMHVVKDMYVTVTLDVREDPLADCGMQDLFYMSRKMTAALLRAAREEQFPLEDAVSETGKTESSGTDAGAAASGAESVPGESTAICRRLSEGIADLFPGDSQGGITVCSVEDFRTDAQSGLSLWRMCHCVWRCGML